MSEAKLTSTQLLVNNFQGLEEPDLCHPLAFQDVSLGLKESNMMRVKVNETKQYSWNYRILTPSKRKLITDNSEK